MDKPGLYTVMVFDEVDKTENMLIFVDEADNCVGMVENVLAWTRREAYFSVMRKMPPHTTWDAWRDEDLERWPEDEPSWEFKVEFAAARLLALGRITEAPSDETVRRWCRCGLFPNAHKVPKKGRGGQWRIPEADLLRFQKPKPGPKGGPRRKKGDDNV